MISLLEILELQPPFILNVAVEVVRGAPDGSARRRKRRRSQRIELPPPPTKTPPKKRVQAGDKLAARLRPVVYTATTVTVAKALRSKSESAFTAVPAPRPTPPKIYAGIYDATHFSLRCEPSGSSLLEWVKVEWNSAGRVEWERADSDADSKFYQAGSRKRFVDRYRLARELEEQLILSGEF